MSNLTSMPATITAAFMFDGATTLTGCQKEPSAPTPADPMTPFTGITATDISGSVISQDPDDWRPIRSAAGGVDPVFPAYPKPCTTTAGCNLYWRLLSCDSLLVTLSDSPISILRTVFAGRMVQGHHVVMCYTNGVISGIYRIYVRVVRADTVLSTYGNKAIYDLGVGGARSQ